jgi:hypothetical protein|tara:strand:- start:624 stop:854 length:231 start_codon:yes stop_codon:yes gene_type:complete
MMSEKEPVATFVAYDEATAKLYARAADLDEAVRLYDAWIRKIVKHGGPVVNDKPMYDKDTVDRLRVALHDFLGEYL